jgi:O-antigen/teichoic acid export membrane protein
MVAFTTMLRRNVVANVLGGSWAALLALILIPVQVRILGVEAYGLLAFVASTQVLFSIFDLGLSPTITREVAKDTSSDLGRTRELVRSLSVLYWPIGIVLGAAMVVGAGWLAGHWLHLGSLPADRAAAAIRYGAVAILLRWPVSLYAGVIAGRQRFDQLNMMKAAVATVSAIGGLVVLFVSRDLLAYMAWTALAAAIELGGYLLLLVRLVPALIGPPSMSVMFDRIVWSFAAGIGAINLLSMVLTQSDRILISKILPIEVLGYYALAYNIVYGLSLVQTLVTSAMFPAFVKFNASQALDELRDRYQIATRAFMYVYNLPIWLFVFFGHDILVAITSRAAADRAAPILSLLAIGFLFNAATALSYTASIAGGNTWLPIRVNLVAVAGYVPVLIVMTIKWGGAGAAAAWLVLNLYYFPTLLRIVHKEIVHIESRGWLVRNFLPFVGSGLLVFAIGRAIAVVIGAGDQIALAIALVACLAYAGIGYILLGPSLRRQIVHSIIAARRGRALISASRT